MTENTGSDVIQFRQLVSGEIRDEYERMAHADATINTGVLVSAVVHRHMPAIYTMSDADEAAYVVGALHAAVWPLSRDYMNKLTKDIDAISGISQMRFVGGGFETEILQDRYATRIDGEPVHMPLEAMNDLQVEAKAKEYESFAKANQRHADELRRYLRWRMAAASSE